MGSLNNIFNKPVCINDSDKNNLIYIYPITMQNYDEFQKYARLLHISKNHFVENDIPLLLLIFMAKEDFGISYDEYVNGFCGLFSLATHKKVNFVFGSHSDGFFIDGINVINADNYDYIRKIIMNQNLLIEQKIYKSKTTQEWAERTLNSRMANQPKIGIEEMITTISMATGKHYQDLENYSIYQIYSDFYRIRKDRMFNINSMARCQGSDVPIEDFAESLDLYKSPYDDLFVDSNKLNRFNK